MSKPTISACIIMHDDYDALQEAIEAVLPYIDELVVVDGAYDWIAPFLTALGEDPGRSRSAALDIVNGFRSRVPVKYIAGVWENELRKREALYEAATCDYVYLVDADEIHEFRPDAFAAFHDSPKSVAMAHSPFYADADHIGFQPGQEPAPNKPVMFKRDRISAKAHASYLWLVLTPEEKAELPERDDQDFFLTEPIAINHHLSHMRSLRTSYNRAAFYNMLSIRGRHRLAWWGDEAVTPDGVADLILSRLSAGQFYDLLKGNYLALGFDPHKPWRHEPSMASGRVAELIHRIGHRQQAAFVADHAALADRGRIIIPGQVCFVDVTRWPSEGFHVTVENPGRVINLIQYDMCEGANGMVATGENRIEGNAAAGRLSMGLEGSFRRIIGIGVWWPTEDGYKSRLRIVPE